MALGSQIVNFIGLHPLDYAQQTVGIGHIAIVQEEAPFRDMRVLIQVVDALRVQQGTAPLDTVHLVSLGEEKLGKIGTILAGDTGD
jgi:hypothetical protein